MSLGKRRAVDRLAVLALAACVLLALFPLASVLLEIVRRGAPTVTLAFLTGKMAPVGEEGGIGHAILGSAILLAVAMTIGLTLGIAIGTYVAEYPERRLAVAARFVADVMGGVPAIVIGVFAYAVLVRPFHRFSVLSGGVALGVLAIPIVVRATEEALKMVPRSLIEAGLALGISRWRTTVSLVLPSAWPALATGALLAAARVGGEAAPLIFTAFGDRGWPSGLLEPIASLPVAVYTFAISPFESWRAQAWGAALVLVVLVLAINLGVRAMAARQSGSK
ncbi:phosphate ABC transporter permease PstA [bacterium]|nr:phosphate ABC transporter permease PstA [bacterium]